MSNSGKFWVFLAAILAIMGLSASAMVLIKGHSILGSTNAVPWNIFVSDYVFFVVTSTGVCFVSALGHVFGLERYRMISQRAVYLSLILLVVGGIAIAMDVGRPWMMITMFFTPNLSSPMFWMALLYSFYGLFLVVELWYLKTGASHEKVKTASTLAALTALVAHSMLGALFGMVQAKALWFGPYLPIYFILSALISGLAVLIVLTMVTYIATGKSINQEMDLLIKDMSKLLFYAVGAGIFFVAWKTIAGQYSGKEDAYLMTGGPFSLAFWAVEIFMGLVVPFIMLAAPNRNAGRGALASVLVLIGLFVARYDLVIAGQLVQPWDSLGLATYSVTTVEVFFTVGLFGIFGVLYAAGLKFLGLEDSTGIPKSHGTSKGVAF